MRRWLTFLIDTYRNQQEIESEVLDSVVGTPLWNQFAGRYYEVYGKEYQGGGTGSDGEAGDPR